MKTKIYQIQIALKKVKPKVWRRVLIPSDLLLSDFHKIIQTTMGWANVHMHQFVIDDIYYSVKHPDDDFWDESDTVDYKKKKLCISSFLKKEKDRILYEYDFGDGWEHDIILEKILPVDNNIKYPVCLTGKMNCPPEDCGGAYRYNNIRELLKQQDNKDYESRIDWLGRVFDPTFFNKDGVNECLMDEEYGCPDY